MRTLAAQRLAPLSSRPSFVARFLDENSRQSPEQFGHRPLDVNHRRVEERQAGRFGAAQQERQFRAGHHHRVDAALAPQPADNREDRLARLRKEPVLQQFVDVLSWMTAFSTSEGVTTASPARANASW